MEISEEKYIYPSSIANVIFENTESDEGRSLKDLILVPCVSSTLFSVSNTLLILNKVIGITAFLIFLVIKEIFMKIKSN